MKLKKSLSIFSFILIAGCAPGLGETVELSALPPFESDKQLSAESYNLVKVNVLKFIDTRQKKDAIKVNNRSVGIEGDLGTIVQTGLIDGLKNYGAQLCLFDCVTISGEITDWSMNVHPNFPATKVEARAKLKLIVQSKDGHVLYTGTYGGSTNAEHPMYSEERLLDTFGSAMNEAISSALQDPKIINSLNRNSN